MNIDEKLYTLPLVGIIFKKLYFFFKKNTLITNIIHLSGGFGLGLLLASSALRSWACVFIFIYLVGHFYALFSSSKR